MKKSRIRVAGDTLAFGGVVPEDKSVRAARELQHAPWRRGAKFLSAEVGEQISLNQLLNPMTDFVTCYPAGLCSAAGVVTACAGTWLVGCSIYGCKSV
jgi:hypothetical protein